MGKDPQAEKQALREIPTFAGFANNSYLPHAKSYKRSWTTDEIMLRVHLVPALGGLHMDEVTPQHVDRLLNSLRQKNYASGTVGRALVLLRHIFNLARRWKVAGVGDNPTGGFTVPADVQRSRYLTKDEAARLITSIKTDENRMAATAILALLMTGARRNEITQAKWDYVNWDDSTLLVPLAKSGHPRTITLISSALELLRSIERVDGNPYIFPAARTGKPSPHLFFPWDRIRKRAGLEDVRLHDLRHSFASFLVNRGASLYRVQKLLGHAHSRSTARYSHLSKESLAETAETLVSILDLKGETALEKPPDQED